MSDTWSWFDSGPGEPAFNMALDEALLESATQTARPLLRFYGWNRSAASFGYFQTFDEVAKSTLLRPLIRRPTGGGLVPHDADWTYSVVIPAGHAWHRLKADESYRRMHQWIRCAFQQMDIATELALDSRKPAPGQCFAGHEVYDVLWKERKIAGAAQRRTRTGLLIQGSVQPPTIEWNRRAWQQSMREVVGAHRESWRASDDVMSRASALAAGKYATDAHNRRR
jgi:lipoate-protein ligase A